ncbi:MAG: F0F1 ATP synthase subunit beta, partial [Lachnospiraceae bacterium]|nr:F0F1 ATP synthase subunit beta [Lachnospiraceae bacterium]
MEKIGKVTEIISAVLDVRFEGELPDINEEIRVTGANREVTVEVAQDLGDGIVRCIALGPTDGLRRGDRAVATGHPITVPVGPGTLGRIFNVLGEAIDGKGEVEYEKRMPIHRKAPAFSEQVTTMEMLETGIKVIDLLCPYLKGGKTGLFGGAGVGKTVL